MFVVYSLKTQWRHWSLLWYDRKTVKEILLGNIPHF